MAGAKWPFKGLSGQWWVLVGGGTSFYTGNMLSEENGGGCFKDLEQCDAYVCCRSPGQVWHVSMEVGMGPVVRAL